MGSLERVQYKFASIIGELCSEPLLLSQFAVWLDMKLAEYKAKGSISLDCSGEKPEPPWMKGVLPPFPGPLPTALFEEGPSGDVTSGRSPFLKSGQHSQKSNFSRNQSQDSMLLDRESYNSESRIKPEEDFLVIKEEVGDDQSDCIYEPNNRLNDSIPQQSIDNYSETAFRKRLSSSDSQFTSHNIASSSKIRRMGSTSAAAGSPLSAASSQNNAGTSRDIEPSLSEHTMFSPGDPSQAQNTWLGQVTADREAESPAAQSAQIMRKAPGAESGRRTTSTRRNINAVVRNFQRWLTRLSERDDRQIEDIEVEKLDGYLAEFFSTTRKITGENYSPYSLGVYRSSLEKYLKEHSYPFSILFSSKFAKSQLAFRQRKAELEIYFANSAAKSPGFSLTPEQTTSLMANIRSPVFTPIDP